MSDRLEKILEAGEDNRQADIERGRQLERERIIGIIEENPDKPWLFLESIEEGK
jgi:hypothetical protein